MAGVEEIPAYSFRQLGLDGAQGSSHRAGPALHCRQILGLDLVDRATAADSGLG